MAEWQVARQVSARRARIAAVVCLVGLACNATTIVPTPTHALATPIGVLPTSGSDGLPPTRGLATPYAQQPAAGICGSFDGPIVEFHIEPGIPDPRCARVRPDQQLTVTNDTDGPVDIAIGDFTGHLGPGDVFDLEVPFGSYLAPGVHILQVLPCCGPEIVLEETPQ
jgi:hypothetical protein